MHTSHVKNANNCFNFSIFFFASCCRKWISSRTRLLRVALRRSCGTSVFPATLWLSSSLAFWFSSGWRRAPLRRSPLRFPQRFPRPCPQSSCRPSPSSIRIAPMCSRISSMSWAAELLWCQLWRFWPMWPLPKPSVRIRNIGRKCSLSIMVRIFRSLLSQGWQSGCFAGDAYFGFVQHSRLLLQCHAHLRSLHPLGGESGIWSTNANGWHLHGIDSALRIEHPDPLLPVHSKGFPIGSFNSSSHLYGAFILSYQLNVVNHILFLSNRLILLQLRSYGRPTKRTSLAGWEVLSSVWWLASSWVFSLALFSAWCLYCCAWVTPNLRSPLNR